MNKSKFKAEKVVKPAPTPVYVSTRKSSRSFVSKHTGKFTYHDQEVLKLAKKMYLTAYPHGAAHLPPYSDMFGGFLEIADGLVYGEISYAFK